MVSLARLEKGLDSGTAFEILSIDIADVDVGRILEPNFRLTRQKPTRRSPRPRRKNAVPWR